MQSDEEYESSQQGDDDGEVSQDQTNDEGERVMCLFFFYA